GWLEALDEVGQGEAYPWNNHRPTLDTAQTINPLLKIMRLEDILQRIHARLGDLTFNGDRPGIDLHVAGVGLGISLVGAELIKIVIRGDVAIGGNRSICHKRTTFGSGLDQGALRLPPGSWSGTGQA